jgi:hypothetical protein
MFRSAAGALLRATRQTAKGSNYVTVVSSSAKQATAQPSPVALPSLSFVRGFAAAAEPAPVASSAEGTVVQVMSCFLGLQAGHVSALHRLTCSQ